MRKVLISIATAVSALAIAAPASAQVYGGRYGNTNDYNGYNNYNGYSRYNRYDNDRYDRRFGGAYESRRLVALNQQRIAKLHSEIRQFVAQGRLNPREAARLDNGVEQFRQELMAVARNGMTGREGAIFDARADRLSQEIHARAGYAYGYGRDYDRYDRW